MTEYLESVMAAEVIVMPAYTAYNVSVLLAYALYMCSSICDLTIQWASSLLNVTPYTFYNGTTNLKTKGCYKHNRGLKKDMTITKRRFLYYKFKVIKRLFFYSDTINVFKTSKKIN